MNKADVRAILVAAGVASDAVRLQEKMKEEKMRGRKNEGSEKMKGRISTIDILLEG